MSEMLLYAEEGSPAFAYGVHQSSVNSVQDAAALQDEEMTVKEDGTIEICDVSGEYCGVYGDFISNESSELLMDFTTDGAPIADRLVLGGDTPAFTQDGISVSLVSAYEASAGALFIVVEVDNQGVTPATPNISSSVYIAPDGRQVNRDAYANQQDIFPGARPKAFAMFQGEELGGTFILQVIYDDYYSSFDAPILVVEGG